MKQHTHLAMLSLAALVTSSAAQAAPALTGGPIRLRLSVERETVAADAQGKPRISWTALSAASIKVHPGDVLRYRVQAENTGAVPITGLAVTQPVPSGSVYLAHSADGEADSGAQVAYSLDGAHFSVLPTRTVTGPDGVAQTLPAPPEAYTALRWRFPTLPARSNEAVTYQVRVR